MIIAVIGSVLFHPGRTGRTFTHTSPYTELMVRTLRHLVFKLVLYTTSIEAADFPAKVCNFDNDYPSINTLLHLCSLRGLLMGHDVFTPVGQFHAKIGRSLQHT